MWTAALGGRIWAREDCDPDLKILSRGREC